MCLLLSPDMKCDVITGDGEIETSHPYDNSETLCWILNAPNGLVSNALIIALYRYIKSKFKAVSSSVANYMYN